MASKANKINSLDYNIAIYENNGKIGIKIMLDIRDIGVTIIPMIRISADDGLLPWVIRITVDDTDYCGCCG